VTFIALHFAARNGYPDIVTILLACPIVSAKNVDGQQHTPLQLCEQFQQNDWADVAKILRNPQVRKFFVVSVFLVS
jgi:hypothetical protein